MARLHPTTRFVLSAAGALLGLALSVPLFNWLYANFDFMH